MHATDLSLGHYAIRRGVDQLLACQLVTRVVCIARTGLGPVPGRPEDTAAEQAGGEGKKKGRA